MISSGSAPVATSSAAHTPVAMNGSTAIKSGYSNASIVTGVAGFVSFDKGQSYHRVIPNFQNLFQEIAGVSEVAMLRDGATDMTGVFISIW
jgi:hypothetical protein